MKTTIAKSLFVGTFVTVSLYLILNTDLSTTLYMGVGVAAGTATYDIIKWIFGKKAK